MSAIWVSSDWHLGHNNIVKGCTRWTRTEQCRDFKTLSQHDEILLGNINKCVKPDDYLYFLGDFSFGGKENIWLFRDRIQCKNIIFIGGNHDKHIRSNTILTKEKEFKNAQDLFSSYTELLEKKIGNETFIMCHYPFRTWHKIGKGSIMLHGHTHGNLDTYIKGKNILKTMDVGIDTHPEFRPYHIDEIRKIMEKRTAVDIENRIDRT